jgi:hypothetical protein
MYRTMEKVGSASDWREERASAKSLEAFDLLAALGVNVETAL